jgi:hypothetical protein
VNNAVVATTHERFGNGRVHDAPVRVTQTQELVYVRGALPVKPGPASLVAGAHNGTRPPDSMLSRRVMATRPPREPKLPWRTEASKPEAKVVQERRFVLVPKNTSNELQRPEFGAQTGAERTRTPLPPRFGARRREDAPVSAIQKNAGRIESPIRSQIEPRTEPKASRTAPSEPATPPGMMREAVPQRPVQQPVQQQVQQPIQQPVRQPVRQPERMMPESRRTLATPVTPRAAPAETRQQERADLPGKPANRVFRVKEKVDDKGEKIEQRRSQQRPDN